jgi:hypothetical protein
MLAYNKNDLSNLFIHKQVEESVKRNFITQEEKKNIFAAYPDNFYSPNIFMRIGLGLVILTASWSIGSLILVIIKSKTSVPYFLVFLSALLFFILEIFIGKFKHYRSGIDDLLLYSALLFIYIALAASSLNDIRDFHLILLFSMTLAGILAVLRYADRVAAAQALITFLLLIGALWFKAGIIGKYTMPLLEILLCLSAYISTKYFWTNQAFLHYSGCLRTMEIISLACLYASGNYFVVDQWWMQYCNSVLAESSWKYFFIAFTILFPLGSLYSGLLKQDHIRIRLSVLMIAASIISFHYYLDIISNEGAMIIYGILIIIAAYLLIKKIKDGIKGYTWLSLEDTSAWIEFEELFIGGSFSSKKSSTEKKKID